VERVRDAAKKNKGNGQIPSKREKDISGHFFKSWGQQPPAHELTRGKTRKGELPLRELICA